MCMTPYMIVYLRLYVFLLSLFSSILFSPRSLSLFSTFLFNRDLLPGVYLLTYSVFFPYVVACSM